MTLEPLALLAPTAVRAAVECAKDAGQFAWYGVKTSCDASLKAAHIYLTQPVSDDLADAMAEAGFEQGPVDKLHRMWVASGLKADRMHKKAGLCGTMESAVNRMRRTVRSEDQVLPVVAAARLLPEPPRAFVMLLDALQYAAQTAVYLPRYWGLSQPYVDILGKLPAGANTSPYYLLALRLQGMDDVARDARWRLQAVLDGVQHTAVNLTPRGLPMSFWYKVWSRRIADELRRFIPPKAVS